MNCGQRAKKPRISFRGAYPKAAPVGWVTGYYLYLTPPYGWATGYYLPAFHL
ncbi:hypothetical protein [Catalinimonas niigatensis]|uniref:hypothetical protein n=1 Tax=Catalinimonas niigatensis TaxID=1397264 RepID=UPI002666A4FE|nr:hypothetical protein [Catalinimonas niigatensis]WPP49251.1 hypothetical protein PZB72_21520 [Catalinimonas niigatensis]